MTLQERTEMTNKNIAEKKDVRPEMANRKAPAVMMTKTAMPKTTAGANRETKIKEISKTNKMSAEKSSNKLSQQCRVSGR